MSHQGSNLFLERLSPENRNWLLSRSTFVELPSRTSLYAAEEIPAYAYFMTSGIASVVTAMDNGKAAEVGVIGREGIAGCFQLLGPALVSTDCYIQMNGSALRIRFLDLQIAFRTREEIRDRILQFVQEEALSLSQIAACHRLHEQKERLARWLLMVQDRTETDQLEITQEFLAEMLGSKRTTVTVVAGELQREGSIEYTRGKIRILDRPKLEAAACGCYKVLRNYYLKLYEEPWVGSGMPLQHAAPALKAEMITPAVVT